MKRLVNRATIKCLTIKSDQELVQSLNKEHCITNETKIIIVGTITPPKACGYFYTSPYNCIYGYIDEARGINLKELKRKLKTDTTVKSQIIKTLQNEKIAFLDIMEEAIRKKNSSADDEIEHFSLDCDSFENVFGKILANKKVKVICNSRLAQAGYNKMKNDLEGKGITWPDSIYIPQVRRLQKIYKSEWLKELK